MQRLTFLWVLCGWISVAASSQAGEGPATAEQHRAACDRGVAAACGALAEMHFTGKGATRDKAQAIRLNRKACDGGYAKACSDLAIQYETGLGVAKSGSEATRLYRKACESGYAGACYYLGELLREGKGVPANKTQAARSYRIACDGGTGFPYRDACYRLAVMLDTGDGVVPSIREATRLYQKACEQKGIEKACAAWQDKRQKQAASEPGAVTTASGLVYRQLAAGQGPSPSVNNVIVAHYHGTLADGSVFDSSIQRGKPFTAKLNQVILCWREGIAMMKAGGKARLTCPPAIAYGSRGAGRVIPPNATLTFEIELLEVRQ